MTSSLVIRANAVAEMLAALQLATFFILYIHLSSIVY